MKKNTNGNDHCFYDFREGKSKTNCQLSEDIFPKLLRKFRLSDVSFDIQPLLYFADILYDLQLC